MCLSLSAGESSCHAGSYVLLLLFLSNAAESMLGVHALVCPQAGAVKYVEGCLLLCAGKNTSGGTMSSALDNGCRLPLSGRKTQLFEGISMSPQCDREHNSGPSLMLRLIFKGNGHGGAQKVCKTSSKACFFSMTLSWFR